jgi:two-component system LytT family response regulator
MVSVILLEDNEINLLKLHNYLKDYKDFEISGMYTKANDALLSIEKKKPDIVFFGARSIYLSDTDIIIYIKKVKQLSKLIIVIQEDYDLKFLELKEIEHNPFSKNANNFLLPNTPSVAITMKNYKKNKNRQITCFGRLTIVDKNNVAFVKWRTKKVKELFAYLICRHDKKISKDELITILFNGEDKTKALNHLYVTMSYLRKHLKDMGLLRKEFFNKK